jgi:hypothetical protein
MFEVPYMSKDNLMNKSCGCGGTMTIHMHTLLYSTKVKITGVPVFTCNVCSRYEPLPVIKRDLGKLISELGQSAARQRISFTQRNEWAHVLSQTIADFNAGIIPDLEEAMLRAVQSRVDLLLDIYRFASDCGDQHWMQETGVRLSQLTPQSAEKAK